MTKAFVPYRAPKGTERGYLWLCPGCGDYHSVSVEGHPTLNWKFDGNEDKPTFSPSVRVRGGGDPNYCCHFFIRAGVAEFCGDCSHANAGKKLPVLPDEDRE